LADVYGMLLCTWVVIGSRLTTADHVAAVCRAKYYQFRQLKPMTHLKVFLRKSLSKATFERKLSDVAYTLAQVFTCES